MAKIDSTKGSETKKSRKKNKGVISFDEETVKKEDAVEVMERNTGDKNYGFGKSHIEPNSDDMKQKTQRKKQKKCKVASDVDNVPHQMKEEIPHSEISETENLDQSNGSVTKMKKKKRNRDAEANGVTNENGKDQPKKIKLSDEVEPNAGDNLKSLEVDLKKDSKRSQKKLKHEKLLAEKKLKAEVATQESVLNYLSKWKHCRQEWKFEKLKQIWLSQNMLDCSKIPNEFWETVVEYFTSSKGFIRKLVLRDALKVIEDEEKLEDDNVSEDQRTKIQRARDIVQNLQE
ncbi:uncharacterized protein [Leptinotarsa decemlineata]|uniref:uncharacterized protein n=1 Tax=Leptinotarsa decemlineata TaxID=7539 RepID=UPI003D308C6D